ncbi:hypothetical protein R6Q57_003043 [Mikania cordata]
MTLLRMCVVIFFALCQFAAATQINSNSVLVALLDSGYTKLSELTLEKAVTNHNITIFAPINEALEREIHPEFKRLLLEPRNLPSLQTLLLHHIISSRLGRTEWPENTRHTTLSSEPLHLSSLDSVKLAGNAEVVHLDDVFRPDGIIHGINQLLIPKSVQQDFNNRRSLRAISAVKPEGAPEVDPRTNRLCQFQLVHHRSFLFTTTWLPSLTAKPPLVGHAPCGMGMVAYNELADILVNLTNLATEMGKLVSEGYVLTVLAPNDEAMAKLTVDQLAEPGAPERIMYYHILPEYQTEESMYNAVRRFGKIRYDTLHVPHKVVAQEADGSMKFGDDNDESAYLFDPNIYTDSRISVQGIDGVLFPASEKTTSKMSETVHHLQTPVKSRRGTPENSALN